MQFQTAKVKGRKIAVANGHNVKGNKFFKFNSYLYGLQCKKCDHWVFIDLLGVGEICGELTKRACE